MPPAGESDKKEGFVAKAAGVAVVSGIAWSIFKSLSYTPSTAAPSSSSSSSSVCDAYHVSKGDTLFSISQRFGVSLEALKAANRVHGDEIFAGDELVIPK